MQKTFFAALFYLPALISLAQTDQKVVSGVVLLSEKKTIPAGPLTLNLREQWKIKIDNTTINEKTMVIQTPEATIMIAYLDYPAASPDFEAALQLSWLWPTARTEARAHQAQALISVIGSPSRTADLYRLFTKTAACILQNTTASGVLIESQYLVLERSFYIAAARNMRDNDHIPLYCWVYFGMVSESEAVNSAYTYGLQEFGIHELEIVRANMSAEDAHNLLYEMSDYLIRYNVKPRDGQKITTPDGASATLRLSDAEFIKGEKSYRLN